MKRKFKVYAGPQRKTTDEMLQAFESKLDELKVLSASKVTCSTGDNKEVYIDDLDYNEYYEDVDGGFGNPGEVLSLGEIKGYWNHNYSIDPVLEFYADFDEWWDETVNNYSLRQIDTRHNNDSIIQYKYRRITSI